MRKAGCLAAKTLDFITKYVKPGITTEKLNHLCHNFIVNNKAKPAPLNYNGFPKSICTSVNHVVCHGIPSKKILGKKDIINIDVTVILDGWYGDTSRMFIVGETTSIKAKKLIQITYKSMMEGIKKIKPEINLGDIGYIIEKVANDNNFSIVKDFCGHGVGTKEVKVLSDGWTAITKDRQLSAQFEHTIGVTKNGYEIFTLSPKNYHKPPY